MAAEDTHAGAIPGPLGPWSHWAAITPHDTNELGFVTCVIQVAVGGTVTLVTLGGDTVQLTCVAGYEYKVRAIIIKAAGTAATGIIAGW